MIPGSALFSTILPWAFITSHAEGVVVQKNGVLQRTFAYRAPDAGALNGQEINSISVRAADFAKRHGQGWALFIEAQRFCTRDYPKIERYSTPAFPSLASYLIEREREEMFSASGQRFESSYFITFAWKPPAETIKKLASLFVQSPGAKDGSKSLRENVEAFVNESDAAAALLANNILLAPLNNSETIAYLHSTVSFNSHNLRFPSVPVLLDRILPDSPLVNSLTMRLGDFFIPIIGVNDFPEETYPAILEGLNRARMEYRWVTRFICLSKDEGISEAVKKEKNHRGNRETLLQAFVKNTSDDNSGGRENRGASIKEEDSSSAGAEIDTDVASLGFLTSSIMVWDSDYQTAKDKAAFTRNVINSAGFSCKEETFNGLEAFRAMLPGDCYSNVRTLPVMSYSFSHVIPLSSVWAGLRFNEHAGRVSGVSLPHVTCATLEGTPFFLSLNPGGDLGHAAVIGPSGAGKSTLLGLLMAQFFRYPDSQVIAFDKGKSARLLCLASGGLFFEPAAENAAGVSFQPLRSLETERDMEDASDFIESLCTLNECTVTGPVRSAIKTCLEILKDKPPENRTITTFDHYLDYRDPDTGKNTIKTALKDYLWAGGKFGKIFDSSLSGLSLDSRFLVFEMEELMNRGEGCTVPALVYLFNLVERKFSFGGRLSLLVLDEAWLFLKNETFSAKIEEWLKVLRKKNVFVLFATQDAADIISSPIRTVIAQQCLTKIFLADNNAAAGLMRGVYAAFGLSDHEIELIASSVMKRDYFYTSPLGRRLFQLDLGPLTLALIGTPDHKLLDRLAAEKGRGVPLCSGILDNARIRFEGLIQADAPQDIINPQQEPVPMPPLPPQALPPPPVQPREQAPFRQGVDPASLLDAAASLNDRRKKGQGRAAESIAKSLGAGVSLVYQARSILRFGNPELIAQVRNGDITVKKACKLLAKSRHEVQVS